MPLKKIQAKNAKAKSTTKSKNMEKQGKFTFSIQSLLEEKDGKLRGPMSPLLFAQEMAEQAGFKFNRLARLWFSDETIHQRREDGGLTGFDTLLMGAVYKNDLSLSLWVDEGVHGIPVALALRSDGEVKLKGIYEKQRYARRLTLREVRTIFQSVFDDPTQIDLKA